MKYLLDTDICIYIIKRKPTVVFERLRDITFESIAISSISVAELEYGVRKSSYPEKNNTALKDFLAPFAMLDFGYATTVEYGIIRSALEIKGTPIGPMDLLIAAHARSLDLALVTNNESEFRRIDGLRIENWTL